MSFNINWDLLKDSKEADQVKDYLNQKFKEIEEQKPDFLGVIEIQKFSFGRIAPEVAIVNIEEPLEEFYADEESDEESQNESQRETSRHHLPAERDPLDSQVKISISYDGDLSMTIKTELIVNQPTPKFMSLPLILTITKSKFSCEAIVAYIGNSIHFCLDDCILHHLDIDSAIGDENKQVLKNVGKIEKFIVYQLQAFLNDFIVYPNYHSVILTAKDEN